ncbi:SDR family NAD(P)-dependent oxidoreductase [Phytomonospora endophytica]|uniref:NAD(P)-dependent dehydrogenase (Short-subunit alcohol dehydrogenase family) n=1 Tax=Phytomonospora endophytica TaxID=714109 RepID=A0A841FF14_9ACTN|nr:SDR family NAD(P)-dependent oxidoreductase [Phytomonospora endophytica]MBB6035901.1 NAD(P)-dependent dehydrogenase (short-subunit alcohol dehydrogenase family) [Phytomonospora endophytica]
MGRFAEHAVLVTGGAHGIGRAVAARLSSEGAVVTIADRDVEAAEATAAELSAGGATVVAVACDVTDRESVDAAVASAVEAQGRLDVLVNNVGVAGWSRFEDLEEEEWHRQADPTLLGAFRCVKAALPHLLDSPHGNVVSVGSINGIAAFGEVAYSAAKAGLQSLTQNLAVEYSPRSRRAAGLDGSVRVNLVAPGSIRTRAWEPEVIARIGTRYPMFRPGEPADIAAAVAFLASGDAAWITGLILPVDGGLLADGRLLTDVFFPG